MPFGSKSHVLITSLLLIASVGYAGNFSFTGDFTADTDLQFFTFTVAVDTPGVLLRTWSYAGGTNSANTLIPAGGFEPYLNLYLADGTQMNPGAPNSCGGATAPDPVTKECNDVYYPTTVSFPGGTWQAGTYTLVLSNFANPGVGNLSDGFQAEAAYGLTPPANYTCQVGGFGYQGNPPTYPVTDPFCDDTGTLRTGAWAVDIIGVTSATEATTTPEPGSLSLALLGGLALLALRIRR
jgi:hypothetical protein